MKHYPNPATQLIGYEKEIDKLNARIERLKREKTKRVEEQRELLAETQATYDEKGWDLASTLKQIRQYWKA